MHNVFACLSKILTVLQNSIVCLYNNLLNYSFIGRYFRFEVKFITVTNIAAVMPINLFLYICVFFSVKNPLKCNFQVQRNA